MRIAAVIMASGFSKRMGSNKLLLRYKGKPLIEYVMDAVKQVDFAQTVIVSSYEEILNLGEIKGFETVKNDFPQKGQSHSVQIGTNACKHMDAIMYIPGDMPFLTEKILNQLLMEAKQFPQDIIRPVYEDKPGNPVIFPSCFFEELLTVNGDAGGRFILKKYPDRVKNVYIFDTRTGADIDTPEDIKKWL